MPYLPHCLHLINIACPVTHIFSFTYLTTEQIYVEIERARLTRELACIKEEEGNIEEAAEILQEVAVVCLQPFAFTSQRSHHSTTNLPLVIILNHHH